MKKIFIAGMLLCQSAFSFAGGFLTNTNQSVLFLRNPAIDAYIRSIENAYSNPAGTAFLSEGFHISLSLQNARQKRIVESTFGSFMDGQQNNGLPTKKYMGTSYAPVIPSFQAGYVMGDWAFSASFGIIGGGGKCEFEKGLGSFEAAASMIPMLGKEIGISSYDINTYMRGRQYYYGFQLGAAYKATPDVSVYGGLRLVYASTNYYGYVKDITLGTAGGNVLAPVYFSDLHDQAIGGAAQYQQGADQCRAAAQQYQQMGDAATAAQFTQQAAVYQAYADQYTATAAEMKMLAAATEDVTLNCDQTGWGFTPIIGVDWKINDHWNVAAKYEFKTRMRLKNRAANSASCDNLAALNQFRDGQSVAEDVPSLLTVGMQYTPFESLRLSAGFHFYDDKNATKYGHQEKLLSRGTEEILAGVEYDINRNITASAGWQNTSYGLTDAYMKDMSFITSSNSIGLGVRVNLSEKCHLDLAYFTTFYKTYDKNWKDYNNTSNLARLVLGDERVDYLLNNMPEDASGDVMPFSGTDSFTRKNRVFAAGISFDF